jgi:thiol:disulfide interchange protein
MKQLPWLLAILAFLLSCVPLGAQGFLNPAEAFPSFGSEKKVPELAASLVCEKATVTPGEEFWVAAKMEVLEGWHIYWTNPGKTGGPVSLEWELPEGVTAGEIQWPVPHRHFANGEMSHTYEGTVYFMVPVTLAENFPGDSILLKAKAVWFVCQDVCKRGKGELTLTLPVAKASTPNEVVAAAFAKTREKWPVQDDSIIAKASYDDGQLLLEFPGKPARPAKKAKAAAPSTKLDFKLLIIAFVGGAILNLMPCVFPVIGLKVMGFVNQAGEDKKAIFKHGLVYTAGVVASFWVLAGTLVLLRQGGAELGWGFQLQDPRFVFLIAVLLFVFALNLSGLFEVGTSLMGAGSQLSSKGGLQGSFFSGVLATIVSTPCAAPFLATALGAALTLEASASILVFTVIALGLAFPYLLLSAFPKWVGKLPRPGAWMETFKQLMAFPIYATVVWLLSILSAQIGGDPFLDAMWAMVLVAIAAWVYGRWFGKGSAKLTAVVILVGSCAWAFPDARPSRVPQYMDLYFFPEPVLASSSFNQELPEKQDFQSLPDGKTYVRLPLAEGAEENLEATGGRLKGILFLEDGATSRPVSIDAPLEKVESTGRALAKAQKSTSSDKLEWGHWTPENQKSLLAEGKTLYIDFTAEWCATCKLNKRVALSSKKIAVRFKETGILPLKADWTNDDPAITKELAKYSRGAVPFNVILFPDGREPIELPELLTQGVVLDALGKAASPGK